MGVSYSVDVAPIWRGWPGDMPTGQMPSPTAAREHTADTEIEDFTAEQGKASSDQHCFPFGSLGRFVHWRVRCRPNWRRHPVRSDRVLESPAMQVRLGACVGVQDGGKENVDPAATPRLVRKPRLKKVPTADEDVPHCTQIPATRSKTALKRTRIQEQGSACAEGGGTLRPAHRESPGREG